MTRVCAALATVAVTFASTGCSPDPYGEDVHPPVEDMGVRITKGIGTSNAFQAGVEVLPDSEIQVRTKIADGEAVVFRVPRGPVETAEVVAGSEEEGHVPSAVTIASASGEPLTFHRLFEFDPGYLSVEHRSTDDTLEVRVTAPRLTGTGQGQALFSFKTLVR
jgi:hypothetical protein